MTLCKINTILYRELRRNPQDIELRLAKSRYLKIEKIRIRVRLTK